MRAFVISLCIFALLLLTIVGNCIFLHRTTRHMEEALRSLPVGTESEALSELEIYWKEKRTAMSFSIVFDEIRRMDELLIELRVTAQQGDEAAFSLSLAQAIETVDRMRRLERFSMEALI